MIYEVLTDVYFSFSSSSSGSTGHSKVSSVKNMLDVEGRPQEGPSCAVAHGSLEGLLLLFFVCLFVLGFGLCFYFLGIISGSSEAVSLENLVQLQKLLSQATPVDYFFLYLALFRIHFFSFLRRTLIEKNIDLKKKKQTQTNPGPFS